MVNKTVTAIEKFINTPFKKKCDGMMARWYVLIFSNFLCLVLTAQLHTQVSATLNPAAFKNPPLQNQVHTWWHWIDNHVTREGITKDLEAMKQQGISGATILNVNQFDGKLGNATVKFGSTEWYDLFKYALHEASRLNLEIGVQNCDGWSTSGGPWITPENSMKQYIWSKNFITGGKAVQVKLDQSVGNNNFYRDALVVAYRSAKPNSFKLATPQITTADGKENTKVLTDGYPLSTINLKVDEPLLIRFDKDFKAEALHVFTQRMSSKKGTHQTSLFDIEASEDGIHFNKVGQVADSVVNEPFLLPFPSTTAKIYRITLKDILNNDGGKEMRIGEMALLQKGESGLFQSAISSHQAKTVALSAGDMADFYTSSEPVDKTAIIKNMDEVIDITNQMQPDGILNWKAPAGDWTIIRFGYTSTGKKNHPATFEGIGLECDKMDTTALNLHFKNFPQQLIEAAGDLKGKTFTYLLSDSWEALYQNWTAGFEKEFEKRRGYSLVPYIPVLCGEVVEGGAHSEAFLHDFRRTIADLIEENYFKHLADLCHRQGLQLHCEAIYGGIKTPPLDVLKVYQYFDVPMTEFWAPVPVVDTPFNYPPKNRISAILPAHAAFLYNKPVLAAESYTGFALYSDSPWDLKLYGDNALTEGVNQFVLHSYVHQPTEAKPGITLGRFGLSFNRHNTWWLQASAYFEEQARAQYLLQKGKTVSDVLVYLGDKLPVQEGADKTAMLLPDARLNYCNADVLYNRISVIDGKLMLDNETAFQLLLVPDSLLDLATLQRIESLVQQGATVIAPRPIATLSLKNYDNNNASLQQITAQLCGNIDGKTVTENKYGKGRIIWGKPVSQIIRENNFIPDLQVKGGKMEDLMYIHKKANDADVYYVVNKNNNQPVQLEAAFRVSDKAPSLWDPVDGTTHQAALYAESNGVTILPVSLRPRQSLFIVFQKGTSRQHFIKLQNAAGEQLFPATSAVISPVPKVYFNTATEFEMTSTAGGQYSLTYSTGTTCKASLQNEKKIVISEIKGTVTLLNEPQLGPLAIQNFQSLTRFDNPLVKYYSGVAVYQMDLNIPPDFIGENTILMQLNQFGSTAQIEWNGSEAGIVWEPGYRLDITALVKAGNNKVVIKVANPWRNRLIGDMVSSRGANNAWTTSPFTENGPTPIINKNSVLLNSGISQPIIVYSVNRVNIKREE